MTYTAKQISTKYGLPVKEVSRRARCRGVSGVMKGRVFEYSESDMYVIIIPSRAYTTNEPFQPINAKRKYSLAANESVVYRLGGDGVITRQTPKPIVEHFYNPFV